VVLLVVLDELGVIDGLLGLAVRGSHDVCEGRGGIRLERKDYREAGRREKETRSIIASTSWRSQLRG
jgi:hypothetical protein